MHSFFPSYIFHRQLFDFSIRHNISDSIRISDLDLPFYRTTDSCKCLRAHVHISMLTHVQTFMLIDTSSYMYKFGIP